MPAALYQRVYDQLRETIRSGELGVGDRLPSEESLSQRYGVSITTLKRALDQLRNDGFIERRPRLGTFVVNIAPSVAAPRTTAPLVGCVLTDVDDTFGTTMLTAILDASADRAEVVVKRTLGDTGTEDALVRHLVGAGIQGLLLEPSSSAYVSSAVLELIAADFPVVILDRVFPGVPVSSVCSDNVDAGRVATDHLFDTGHQRIGCVLPANRVSTIQDRWHGVMAAHACRRIPYDPGLEFDDVISTVPGSHVPPGEDVERLMAYLDRHPGMTGVVAMEYNIAVLLREAVRRRGGDIPTDLAVVCFDHPTGFYDRAQFRFTHIRQDQAGMGEAALGLVLRQVGQPGAVEKVTLGTTLVVGDSTRAP